MDNHRRILAISIGYVLWCTFLLFMVSEFDEEDEEEGLNREDLAQICEALSSFRRLRKRAFDGGDDESEHPTKRSKYDYERAITCVNQDYLGPDPLFGRHFERIFRVSRSITEKLIQVCGNMTPFFTHRQLPTGELGIYPQCKVLMALKSLGYGCSSSAFIDYFQMSLTSGRDCVKEFAKAVANSELRQQYLRPLTREDAKRVSAMHQVQFGEPGLIGFLDCMHVYWRTCPVAWQGQYAGKEGSPSIVLEAFSDYSAWIWHFKFRFPGTLNDINIWDQSSLLKTFLDGSFSANVDFDFVINHQVFSKLFLLVDGIYPELSRFVKTLSVPLTRAEKKYTEWQESARKSIERAFGIAQRKFQIVTRPIEYWYEEDIENIVTTCFILHNMMVEVRIQREEKETDDWYNIITEENDDDGDDSEDDEYIGRHAVDLDDANARAEKPSLQVQINSARERWPYDGDRRAEAIRDVLEQHFEETQKEYRQLYNFNEHNRLRDAIMAMVSK